MIVIVSIPLASISDGASGERFEATCRKVCFDGLLIPPRTSQIMLG
jgi:hypothetical protein